MVLNQSSSTLMLGFVVKALNTKSLPSASVPGTRRLYTALLRRWPFLEGRTDYVPDDFKRLAVPVFANRVVVSTCYASTLRRSEHAEALVREIVDRAEVLL